MAEKSSELRDDSGVLSDTDKDIISTAASTTDDDAFIEKYSDDYAATDMERRSIETNTSEDAPEETEHLKAQIEETRSQMGETIDAIQEKLSFSNISEQVKDQVSEHINDALGTVKETVYDATIGKVGNLMKNINRGFNEFAKSDIAQSAWQNPLALSLIGLGIGMIVVNGYSRRSSHSNGKNYRRGIYADTEGADYNRRSALRSAQEKIGGAASSAYEGVSNAAGSAYEGVSQATSSAYEGVAGAASTAYGSVTNAAGTAYEKVGELGTQAREQYDYYIEENPLAVGAVALAVGAAVGFSLPTTRYEGELLGEYSQQVLEKAQTAATGLVDKVKTVAGETVQTAQESFKEEDKVQGLTQ
jgi:hypothetical protein